MACPGDKIRSNGKGRGLGIGKGKGPIEQYVAPVRKGRILYEMEGVDYKIAKEALTTASSKLPLKTRVVVREGHNG